MIYNWTDFLSQKPKIGVYLFIGKEEYLLTKIIEHIKISEEASFQLENHFVSRQNELSDIIKKAIERSIFDTRKKIVKAELSRDFAMKRGAKEFISMISKVSNYLLFYGKNLNSRSKFVNFAQENSIPVYYVYPLKDNEKFEYVKNILNKNNLKADNKIITRIINSGPSELFLLESEIKKLSLFCEDGIVKEKDIEEVFSLKKDEKIDNFLENLGTKGAKNILRKLLKDQYDPIYIWTSITNFFTLLYWFLLYKEAGFREQEIGVSLRLYSSKLRFFDFQIKKYYKVLGEILTKLYSIEKDFKYSSKDKSYLLEDFIDFLVKINGGLDD